MKSYLGIFKIFETGCLIPVVTDNTTSVDPVFKTNILLDELDGEAVSEIIPMFSLCRKEYITV